MLYSKNFTTRSVTERWPIFLAGTLTLALAACSSKPTANTVTSAAPASPTDNAKPGDLTSMEVIVPPSAGAEAPRLSATASGFGLAWFERAAPGTKDKAIRVQYATGDGMIFSRPMTVAANAEVVVDSATPPTVTTLSDGSLLALWPGMKKQGKQETQELYSAASRDGGKNWSPPVIVNHDEDEPEHSFFSATALPNGHAAAIWLDGAEDLPTDKMRLAESEWDGKQWGAVAILDDDLCGCCPTAIARTGHGMLAVYRDHLAGDIRDIAVNSFRDGKWSGSRTVHSDGWKLSGCPTNGPAVDADGDRAAVTWFTAAGDDPRVQVAFSSDAGETFSAPIRVDGTGDKVPRDKDSGVTYGYASVALTPEGAIVSWVEKGKVGRSVVARTVSRNGLRSAKMEIASGFNLGQPNMVRRGEHTLITWTEAVAEGGKPALKSAMLMTE